MATTKIAAKYASTLSYAEHGSEGLATGYIRIRYNFFVGNPHKSSLKRLSFVRPVTTEIFNADRSLDDPLIKSANGKAAELYTPHLLAKEDWKCEAHDHPVTATDFYFYSFHAVHPTDYPEMATSDKDFSSAELIPALMVYYYSLSEKYSLQKLLEDPFLQLQEMFAFQPHLNILAVPVCSINNETCMAYASDAIEAMIKDLRRIRLSDWAFNRAYKTAEGSPMCQICGTGDRVIGCAANCDFRYCCLEHLNVNRDAHCSKFHDARTARDPVSLRVRIQSLLPHKAAPEPSRLIPMQCNFFVGRPEFGYEPTHIAKERNIPENYVEDLTIPTRYSVVEDWKKEVVASQMAELLDRFQIKCSYPTFNRAATVADSFAMATHPINPFDDTWKTSYKTMDAVMAHLCLPYQLLVLNTIGAFGQELKDTEQNMALIDVLMDQIGGKKGPVMNIIAIPSCNMPDCKDVAANAYWGYWQTYWCRMNQGLCLMHTDNRDCPGNEGLEELKEREIGLLGRYD